MDSLSVPSDPAAAPDAALDAGALEMADLVTAIFRMLDDNIDAVVSAGGLASSRVALEHADDASAFGSDNAVGLVGAPGSGLGVEAVPHR